MSTIPNELHTQIELESRGKADAAKGTRMWRVKIPDIGVRNYSTPMFIPLAACQDWEEGETKFVHIGRGDRPKEGKQGQYASDYFWNYVGPGNPNAAVAQSESGPMFDSEGFPIEEPPTAPAPRQQPPAARPQQSIDGMRWGNSLNNAAALVVAYPDMSVDELFYKVMPLAARMYGVTIDEIAAFAAQDTEPAADA